jgi:hypothetical protein
MSAALRSDLPPAPSSEPRAKALGPADAPKHRAWLTPLPGLKVKAPKRETGRRSSAERVDRVLRRLGVTNEELAETLEVNPKFFQGWRDATEGIQLGDLEAIGDQHAAGARVALAILDAAAARLRHRLNHGE